MRTMAFSLRRNAQELVRKHDDFFPIHVRFHRDNRMKRDDSMTEREERRDAYHYFAQDGSSWIVREAVTGDLNDLVALDDIAKSVPWGRDAIAGFIGCVPGVFILFPSNRVGLTLGGPVGFVIARWLVTSARSCRSAFTSYRRLGLGRVLMETVRRTALVHGKTSWILEVREHNTPALSLYKSIGFHEVGKRRGYYIDTGEAAILMRGDTTNGDP